MRFPVTSAVYLAVLLGSRVVVAQSEDPGAAVSTFTETTTSPAEPSTTPNSGTTPSVTDGDTPDPEVTPTETEITDPTVSVVSEPTVTESTIFEPVVSSILSGSLEGVSTSTTDGASSASESSGSISPSASASASPDEGTDITAVELTEGEESTLETPPDVTTPEEHEAELVENLPEVPMTEEDARDVAVLETVMFDYFVENAPAPGDVGKLEIPEAISQCEVALTKRSVWASGAEAPRDLTSRSLRGGWDQCRYVSSLQFDVYVNYIKESYDAVRPNTLADRIDGSITFLNSVYEPLGITFTLKDKQFWRPPQTGDNSDWSKINKLEDRLLRWQRNTRAGNKMSLNIWLVNTLKSADGKRSLNGYATHPVSLKDSTKAFRDGVVMKAGRMQNGYAPTLVHEVGHWLGLQHTFGTKVAKAADDCQADDGLLDSTQTRGAPDAIYECSQIPCNGDTAQDISNYMSYSSCRGRVPAEGLTTDQKSAIFARTMKFRRSNSAGECVAEDPDPNALRKRSSMQDLLNGKCPDITAEAERIINEKVSVASGRMSTSNWAWAFVTVASFMALAV
ncbi:hypothetical protein BN1723_005231 [Verticillium longisporum]|uniref:Peptidase M12B domain-containing protein n=1 Tax=Verticillium longisporum TaxID=100787 RepID=A0A0G4N6D6_VERLO|nr:hypothetical protein BN1723_005231 [Verticillium longisporum]